MQKDARANDNIRNLNQWSAVLNCKTEQDHWKSVKADWEVWQSLICFDHSDSECSDSSCNAFERSECFCCNQNVLFCNIIFVLVLFILLCFSVFVLIWFDSINDFFSFFIFNVDYATYHQRDEERSELWYKLLISFILLIW